MAALILMSKVGVRLQLWGKEDPPQTRIWVSPSCPHLQPEPDSGQPLHFLALEGINNACGCEWRSYQQDRLKANGLGLSAAPPGPLQGLGVTWESLRPVCGTLVGDQFALRHRHPIKDFKGYGDPSLFFRAWHCVSATKKCVLIIHSHSKYVFMIYRGRCYYKCWRYTDEQNKPDLVLKELSISWGGMTTNNKYRQNAINYGKC